MGAQHPSDGLLAGRAGPLAPPEALEAFLAAGEKPVYIGFGSMKSGTGAQLLRITLEALRQLNLRAVLAAGWGEVPEEDLPDTVYLLRGFVPHGWLFERVAAAVHHGGAGTTASSLRAGITHAGGSLWRRPVFLGLARPCAGVRPQAACPAAS